MAQVEAAIVLARTDRDAKRHRQFVRDRLGVTREPARAGDLGWRRAGCP